MDEGFFTVTHHTILDGVMHGFRMDFANNYAISVVFGGVTDSDEVEFTQNGDKMEYHCKTAEVAVINPAGELVPFAENESVKGRVKPEELPRIISWAMNR
jgi:hypothetical protein